MDWKQRIKIDIAGRPYFFRVEKEEDEEQLRKAGKLIDEKLFQNQQRYKDKDIQDLLAFVALQFATKTIELETVAVSTEQVEVDRLKQINEQLDTFLNQCTGC